MDRSTIERPMGPEDTATRRAAPRGFGGDDA